MTPSTSTTRPRRNRWFRRLRWLVAIVALLLVSGFAFTRTPGFGASPAGERLARIQSSPQWRDGVFFNRQPQWLDLRSALREAAFGESNPFADPVEPIPVVHTDPDALQRTPTSGLRITWFGHSSALAEIDGVRVLIDPFWGERASPVAGLGPKRWYAPPIALKELPPIDAVVISHDHYDHLDRATIEGMRDWRTVFVVPLGIGAHLERWGIEPARIHELDWWQARQVGALSITATPARHASGRLSNASNRTLWAGYALAGPVHRVWYSGDTGFHDGFAEIGERLGPFDVTLLDAGQYNAHWPDAHMGPELAVEAHRQVRGRLLIPIHWALLNLAPHTWTEPVERVRAEAECKGVALLVLRPGDPVEPSLARAAGEWWPHLPWKSAVDAPLAGTRKGDPAERVDSFRCQASAVLRTVE